MISRILVPLDGSVLAETVLPYVKQLGTGLAVPVELLRVAEGEEADGRQYLQAPAEYLAKARVQVTSRTTTGDPAEQILADANGAQGTLIAMSTHGRSGLGRWLIGSVAGQVLHGASGPLLLIRPAPRSPLAPEPVLRSVLIPLDGSDLAEAVFPHVADLAKRLGLAVTVVKATPSASDYERSNTGSGGWGSAFRPDVQAEMAQADRLAEAYLADAAGRLRAQGLASTHALVIHGDPAEGIISLAREGTLVAMATHGRAGVGRTLLGSVTDRVVRHGGEPVLVVRPG